MLPLLRSFEPQVVSSTVNGVSQALDDSSLFSQSGKWKRKAVGTNGCSRRQTKRRPREDLFERNSDRVHCRSDTATLTRHTTFSHHIQGQLAGSLLAISSHGPPSVTDSKQRDSFDRLRPSCNILEGSLECTVLCQLQMSFLAAIASQLEIPLHHDILLFRNFPSPADI